MKELEKVNESASFIKSCNNEFNADLAIIIGSNIIQYDPVTIIEYERIPHYPLGTINDNKGNFTLATIADRNCYILNGRVHSYDGYSSQEIIRPIRILKALGVKTIIITNVASAVNLDFAVGELMLITDHINFSGDNPLKGEDSIDFGAQFPIMTNAYDSVLQDIIRDTAISIDIPLNEGIFIKFNGPSYETPAEVRIARAVGADAVGMSTVFECIAAVQCGIKVAGISSITHMASELNDNESFDTILETCNEQLSLLISELMKNL